MWTIFKVFIKYVTILLLVYTLRFGHEACGILPSQPGLEPAPPALEDEALTIGPPGKSRKFWILSPIISVLSAGPEMRGGQWLMNWVRPE